MKKILLILLLVPVLLHAQPDKQGIAHYRVKLLNGLYKNAVLYFNDSASLYLYNKRGMDDSTGLDNSSMSYDSGEGALTGVAIKVSEYDEDGAQIYRDFVHKSVSFRETARKPMDAYIVEDTWTEIVWDIKSDFREIAGYHCQKASGSFRGRTYSVWFTRDVPVPYGPWKLFGLPGLIVKVAPKPKKWLLDVELTQLCYPCDSIVVLCNPEEANKKSLKDYVYYTDHILEAVVQKIREQLPEGITVGAAHYDESLRERRNNRLERLFEWEAGIPSELAPDTIFKTRLPMYKD